MKSRPVNSNGGTYEKAEKEMRKRHMIRFFTLISFSVGLVVQGAVLPVQSVPAQADARSELEKISQAYHHLMADEKEYTERTKDHMDRAVKHLIESLGSASIKERFGKDAADVAEDSYNLKQNYDAGIRGDARQQAEILIKQIISKIAGKFGTGNLPGIVDVIFDLLYLHQDVKQHEILEKRQEELDKLRDYWSKYNKGTWQKPPTSSESSPSIVDAEFQQALSHLGIRVRMPNEAVKEGSAQINSVAQEGYSKSEVQIVSRTDDWLALDFSGAYLIPGGRDSSSQRLGFVSVVESDSFGGSSKKRPEHLSLKSIDTYEEAAWLNNETDGLHNMKAAESVDPWLTPDKSIRAWSRRHWLIVPPRVSTVIWFQTVCLDHSRGVPGRGERFYLSDQPLPPRIQRILIAASLNQEVPQGQVWEAIEVEHIKWYDPRDAAPPVYIPIPVSARIILPTGRQLDAKVAPVAFVNGHLMLPIRLIAAMLYYQVSYNPTNRQILVVAESPSGGHHKISLNVGSVEVTALNIDPTDVITGNRQYTVDVPPIIYRGQILVPAKFITEVWPFVNIRWDEKQLSIYITTIAA